MSSFRALPSMNLMTQTSVLVDCAELLRHHIGVRVQKQVEVLELKKTTLMRSRRPLTTTGQGCRQSSAMLPQLTYLCDPGSEP